MDENTHRVYKIVLTGGPCGGKTTGQARLCTFFENLGWKVYRVPETANVLLSGGVKFSELNDDQVDMFQENLLKTMIQIENTYFELGKSCEKDCLIICDRGVMDAAAYIAKDKWEKILKRNDLNTADLRDMRYHQVIHMVSAACGAEGFYTTQDHASRSEDVHLAKSLDGKVSRSWIGHPYFDIIDNSSDFENKIRRMIDIVCQRLGLDTGDRFATNSIKRKWLVTYMPDDNLFPTFQDFDVVHNYLRPSTNNTQVRLRKRGQRGHFNYTRTIRRPKVHDQVVEEKTKINQRTYMYMLTQTDLNHFPIYKKRRCFLHNNQYFQLDIYCKPAGHPRCNGLMLLETYSTLDDDKLLDRLPKFLGIKFEVTGNPKYSMFNLSIVEDWAYSKHFCRSLSDKDGNLNEENRNNEP